MSLLDCCVARLPAQLFEVCESCTLTCALHFVHAAHLVHAAFHHVHRVHAAWNHVNKVKGARDLTLDTDSLTLHTDSYERQLPCNPPPQKSPLRALAAIKKKSRRYVAYGELSHPFRGGAGAPARGQGQTRGLHYFDSRPVFW